MREMKDSGVEWIGEIPKDWNCMRLKFAFGNSNVGESVDKELYSSDENGYIFYTAGANPVKTSYTEFPMWKYTTDNDILLARNGTPYIYLPSKDAVYSDHIIRINIKDGYCRRFLRYCLQRSIESIIVDSVSIATWSISLWKEQKLPLPYYHEQKYLADYLDSKCSKIDEIIEKQQAIIKKLKEYKFSIITEAVTKGINPDVELKDSTIDMCEQIPVHWGISQNRYLFSLRDEKNYKPLEEVRLLSLYTDLGVFPHGEQEERGNKAVKAEGYKVVYENDIVVNIILAWMGAIGRSAYDGVTSPAYDIYKPNENVCSRYYHYLYRTKLFSAECYKYGRGIMAMRWRTYSSEFKSIKVPVPPYIEQCQIADYLDSKCEMLDKTIADRNKAIDILQEYKKSLIYEVVTGKKEV
jgi:type I restriction enzyme S subunit